MQTTDLPVRLHYALFELGGGSGYVLKPPELRQPPNTASRPQPPSPTASTAVRSAAVRTPSLSLAATSATDTPLAEPHASPLKMCQLKGVLYVTICSASGLKAADDNGFSDPYVTLKLGSDEGRSRVRARTLNPKWDETFGFRGSIDEFTCHSLRLHVWDYDRLSASDSIGDAIVSLKAHDLSSGQYVPLTLTLRDGQAHPGKLSIGLRWESDDASDGARGGSGDSGEATGADGTGGSIAAPLWPPPRTTLHRVSLRIMGLYNLPTRRESRPRLERGAHASALACVPELNGEGVPPEPSATPMSPSVAISLHTIGGLCCVSGTTPPQEGCGASYTTVPVSANGLNPAYNDLVYCFATEPRETILKVRAPWARARRISCVFPHRSARPNLQRISNESPTDGTALWPRTGIYHGRGTGGRV